eukprot:scaffold97584_cov31-Tisochrysis_lutea.AAC.2
MRPSPSGVSSSCTPPNTTSLLRCSTMEFPEREEGADPDFLSCAHVPGRAPVATSPNKSTAVQVDDACSAIGGERASRARLRYDGAGLRRDLVPLVKVKVEDIRVVIVPDVTQIVEKTTENNKLVAAVDHPVARPRGGAVLCVHLLPRPCAQVEAPHVAVMVKLRLVGGGELTTKDEKRAAARGNGNGLVRRAGWWRFLYRHKAPLVTLDGVAKELRCSPPKRRISLPLGCRVNELLTRGDGGGTTVSPATASVACSAASSLSTCGERVGGVQWTANSLRMSECVCARVEQ